MLNFFRRLWVFSSQLSPLHGAQFWFDLFSKESDLLSFEALPTTLVEQTKKNKTDRVEIVRAVCLWFSPWTGYAQRWHYAKGINCLKPEYCKPPEDQLSLPATGLVLKNLHL